MRLCLSESGTAQASGHHGGAISQGWFHRDQPELSTQRSAFTRVTAEQWIKEGKYALNWTRLSCHKFVANQVRLWL